MLLPFRSFAPRSVRHKQRKQILQRMCDHARPYRPAEEGQSTRHQPAHCDGASIVQALIGVACSEQRSREKNAAYGTMGHCGELVLEISAVDGLLADARANADQNPENLIACSNRHQETDSGTGARCSAM